MSVWPKMETKEASFGVGQKSTSRLCVLTEFVLGMQKIKVDLTEGSATIYV